jgi:large subunit ribosomal protein L25
MKYELEVESRDAAGKGVARKLRGRGKIPAVVYGSGKSRLIAMDYKVARNMVLSQRGHTGLLTVKIAGEKDIVAVLQDHQLDPMNGAILHVDLFEVSMDKLIRVRLPVAIIGQVPVGVKEGGILQQPLRDLHVECLPGQIPDHIEIDASELKIGQGVHVKDVQAPAGVKILDDEDLMVVHVATKISEAKLESLLTREAGEAAPVTPVEEKAKAEGGVAAPADAKAKAAESKPKEGKK